MINKISMPQWQQRLQWILDPVGYLQKAVKQEPELFWATVSGFGGDIVFVNNPDAIKEILNDRQTYSAAGSLNEILTPIVGDFSLLSLDGKRHQRERKLMMPAFHGDRMHYYGELIDKITDDVFSRLEGGNEFIAREVMQDISLQVILQVVFGLNKGEKFDRIAQLIKSILNRFNQPINISFLFYGFLRKDWGRFSPWGSFIRIQKELDLLIHEEINNRRQEKNSDRVDILSLLLSAVDESGRGMTNRELRDELMLILFAGHETTAIAMAWGLYWSHYHPEMKDKILSELDALPDDSDGMTIYQQSYLSAFTNEVLRIHPNAMLTFPRIAIQDTELLGRKVNKGSVFLGCIYLTHRREDLYPQPEEFRPERFLQRQFSPYEFMPFGGGVRRCIGEALASYELKLVMAKVLQKYRLELITNKPIKPVRRGVVISPKGGVKMKYLGMN